MSDASQRVAELPARVLVTGASRGIGRAIASALIGHGVRLALLGRDRARLLTLVARSQGHAIIDADLAIERDLEGCVDRAADALGGLDGFVSCAGIAEYAPIGSIDRASLERQLSVNFVAPFMLAQRVAAHLGAAGGGSIVLIASTLGMAAAPSTAAYAASKAALISMTHAFALELAAAGVRVNAIAPGVVDTDMVRALRTDPGDVPRSSIDTQARVQAQLSALCSLHPLGRLGHAEEIAETVLYLLRARYVTGTIVTVDGGLLLGLGKP
jgi:NAD(P)-dependent dehydrogenase (short-subunit alcohol dehydrogenase family)